VQRDGACGFLGADGLCEIHRAGGLSAKPLGCAAFPLRLCDDGTAVRVAAATECGCVLRSAVEPGGDPLLPSGSTHVRHLPIVSAVESLPEQVPVRGERTLPREQVRNLVNTLLAALPVHDAAAWLWGVADAIEAGTPIPSLGERPAADAVQPWARALAETTRGRAARDADWRSPRDVTLRGLRWIATTAVALLHADLLDALLHTSPAHPAIESFWLRANLWAYVDVADLGLVPMLRDRALRLWLSRAMPELAGEDVNDPVFAQPLALIDVLMRGHGLSRYVDAAYR
jgi:hypothetical protein